MLAIHSALVFLFIAVLLTIGILFQPSKEEQGEMYPKSDMGIYRELDCKVFNICYNRTMHYFMIDLKQ